MQGAQAEGQVASAIALLARLEPKLDAVVLVRGGGSRSDLAAFDSRRIAEAVARCPLPVLCGLGHEIDRAIADVVCHTSVKTPTEAATFLVDRMRDAEERLREATRDLATAARRVVQDGERRLRRMDRIAQHGRHALVASRRQVESAARALGLLARRRLRESEDSLERLAVGLAPLAGRNLEHAGEHRVELGRRLASTARGHLRGHASVLDGMERLLQGLAPERLLERGYSITRVLVGSGPGARSGALVTAPDQVRSGDRLETRVAGGRLVSIVDTDSLEEPSESPT
jgi:exodeoxyribonuclease VII large subunit